MNTAYFSPMPPSRTGVAAFSAEMVASLAADHSIDVFVDESIAPRQTSGASTRSAHDFLWLNHLDPYDLTVYQLGNSGAHDYQWPYVFRFPGLVVLHDARLHHARAASLLLRGRTNDYRAEFAASERDTSADMAELMLGPFACGAPVAVLSTSPERDDTILMKNPFEG